MTATYRTVHGHEYFIGLGEIGSRFALGTDWTLSVKLEYEEGRNNADDPVLDGFRCIEDTVEAQIGVVRESGNCSLAAALQPDVLQRGKGLVYFLGIGHEFRLSRQVRVLSTVDVSWGDSKHMDTEFGVDLNESLVSGLPEYQPASGLKSSTLGPAAS